MCTELRRRDHLPFLAFEPITGDHKPLKYVTYRRAVTSHQHGVHRPPVSPTGAILISVDEWSGHWTCHSIRFRFQTATASVGLGDRLRKGKPPRCFAKPPRPTQHPTLSGTGNEYRPKCGDALRLSKGRYGSFHLRINVRVAGKTV